MIMSRDEISKVVLQKMGVKNPIVVVSDMAFFLPYKRQIYDDSVINIGLNISGLLWNGGYTKDNQFGLNVDYQRIIRAIIELIKADPSKKLYLIGHVIINDPDSVEDDYSVCKKIAEEYNIEYAPDFKTPIEAKSFISGMDIFIGSRMHATIASYSSGVATIPLAYSRKFVGLFDNLNYPYVLDLCNISDSELLDKIDNYIKNHNELTNCIIDEKNNLEENKDRLLNVISRWIEKID